MNDKFLKPYNPTETEGRIYKLWEESGFFNPDTCIEKGVTEKDAAPYTIIMPPPNANGRLHAGHGLTITLQDIFIRFARMQGKKALWVPGADHAGFETQIVYEKKLEKAIMEATNKGMKKAQEVASTKMQSVAKDMGIDLGGMMGGM